jgi:hypothetical protein
VWNQLKQVTQKNREDHKERAGEDAGKDSTCGKPSGISWGLLCRPAARKLPSEDRNRVCSVQPAVCYLVAMEASLWL